MLIRNEELTDLAAIREVNRLAFGREAEGALVDALRTGGAILCSLVAEVEGQVVGHVLFSPAVLDGPRRVEVAGLGPVAVRPEQQRRGIGDALIRAGLDSCRQRGYDLAVVLGHPAYYPRFGFRPAGPLGIRWEHDAPAEAFMVMELRPGALAGHSGIIRYRPEFEGV